jgi:amino acid transporter
MVNENLTETQNESGTSLKANAMGVPGLFFMVAATVGIVAAFLGASPLVFIMAGEGTPGIYLLCTLAYLIFAGGYLAMSRKFGSASGFIAFVGAGFGKRAGVASAYITLLTFPAFLGALYGIFSMFVQQSIKTYFGADVSWLLIAIIAIVVTTIVSYNRVQVSVKLLGVLLVAGVLLVLVLDLTVGINSIASPTPTFSFNSFNPALIFGPAIGLAMLFGLGSYGGVESTAVFSEEVKDPRKTVSRSLYIAIIVIGLFYILSTWAVVLGVGGENIAEVAAANPTGFIFELTAMVLGDFWMNVLNIILVVSFYGILVGFTNISSRYVFALGRAGLLPKALGKSHKKHQSPHIATLALGAFVLVIVLVFGIGNADPFMHLYTWLIALATVGSLVLIVMSSLATFFFHIRNAHDESAWNAYIAPLLSTVIFGVAIWLSITNYSLLAGETVFAQWLWLLVPILGIIGFGVGGLKRFKDLQFTSLG